MNKNILNKIVSIASIVFVIAGFVLPTASLNAATATFNNDSLDVKTLQIANSTKEKGTFNWKPTASADAGDEVAFLVYYHNTSNTIADNTKIRINLPNGSASNQNISVNVWADNASSIYDNTALNISSSQSLSLVAGSVKWHPNQNSNVVQALPFSQSGDEITSYNGLNIGNIAGGWSTQGYLTLKVKVSGTSTIATTPTVITVSAPAITTYAASNITSNSATLNGIVNPNNASTSVWFEYGTSASSLANSTSTQSFSSSSNSSSFASTLLNISANTTYYFRAVAQNSSGKTYGNTLSFVTSTSAVTAALAPSVATNSATNVDVNSATLNATVNSNNIPTTAWFEYGTSSSSFSYSTATQNIGSGSSGVNTSIYLSNLSTNTTYYFRAVAQNATGTTYGNVLSLATTTPTIITVSAPAITTYAASNITSNSATLNGIVNPNNASTSVWFEYGTSASSLANSTSTQSFSSSSNSSIFASTLSSISANTTYYFRTVAQNSSGKTYGNTLSFVTAQNQANSSAPSVTTNSATAITANTANLNGTINPNGFSTNAWFEYGTSSGSLTKSTSSQNIGGGSSYASVTIGVSGLSSGTTYYFRPVAQNSSGTTYGAINSFSTGSASAASTTTSTTNIKNSFTTINGSANLPFIEIAQSIENQTYPNGNQAENFANIGDKLRYAITLKNSGSVMGYNLKTTVQLPNTLKYVESSSKASYDSVSGTLAWNVARLRSQDTATLYFTVEVVGGLNSTIQIQSQVYIPVKRLNVFSNTVSTIISHQKPVSLKLSVDQNEVKAGDIVEYLVTVKNSNNYEVRNILLSIGLPKDSELREADFSASSKSENSLIVDLGNIAAGNEISKKFSVRIGTNAKKGDILTTIALVNYQDPAGNSQPIVSASASSTVTGSMNLAASIFGGLASFSVLDWITLFGFLIFILVISYIVRKIREKRQQ